MPRGHLVPQPAVRVEGVGVSEDAGIPGHGVVVEHQDGLQQRTFTSYTHWSGVKIDCKHVVYYIQHSLPVDIQKS